MSKGFIGLTFKAQETLWKKRQKDCTTRVQGLREFALRFCLLIEPGTIKCLQHECPHISGTRTT